MKELAEGLSQGIKEVAKHAKSEEDLRVAVSLCLAPVLNQLGIESPAQYERRTVFRGSQDHVIGHVSIEYKRPGRLARKGEVIQAAKQLVGYLMAEASRYRKERETALRKMVGVSLDGERILFIRYQRKPPAVSLPLMTPDLPLLQEEPLKGGFVREGPYPIGRASIEQFLGYLRAYSRRPLTPEHLAQDFGPKTDVAGAAVGSFYEKLLSTTDAKVSTFLAEWERLFGIVYGQEMKKAEESARELAGLYRVQGEVCLKPLLFSVHTYYALLMKLLAVELASLQSGSLVVTIRDLASLPDDELKERLEELEDGEIFFRLGIKNFLEGDFFRWYLSAWDTDLAQAIRGLCQKLIEFEPATTTLEPEGTRDLLKKLYQYLVPKKLRHDLGEYYTPDWLAELVLDRIKYDGDPDKRVIDPGCGSGTFLVLVIKRIRQYAEEKAITDKKGLIDKILQNVVGFDLNPLAVIAARTNYLLALGDLVRHKRPIEIPVYMCDSILTPSQHHDLYGTGRRVPSVVGDFVIPDEVVDKGKMEKLASLLEDCAKTGYSKEEFLRRVRASLHIQKKATESLLSDLYGKVLALEKEGRNRIWARLLKNSFAPDFVGKFDYVVGNPPWVNWESLATEYRQATDGLWQKYSMQAKSGGVQFELGKINRDLAMLFTYAAMDNYLLDKGLLGFLITQTVFKTRGGEVFRKFRLNKDEPFRILAVDDLVELKPFEGAANRTSLFVCQKGSNTRYPVSYILWRKKNNVSISRDSFLGQVLERTKRANLDARPINPAETTSPWITARAKALKALRNILGKSAYKAYVGCTTWASGVYWIRVLGRQPDNLLVIENIFDAGKKVVKKLPPSPVEPDLVFPLLRGREVSRWHARPVGHLLMPHTADTGWQAITESDMKDRLPHTFAYFKEFEGFLKERPGYKQLRAGHPFYIMANTNPYIFSPFKAVWREQASALTVAVVSEQESKPVVPDHKLMLVPFNDAAEAHYVCGALASSLAQFVVKSYILETSTSTHILEHIAVPKFDPKNEVHNELSRLSIKAHELAAKGDEKSKKELLDVEAEIDLAAAELWDITPEELNEIKRSLKELL